MQVSLIQYTPEPDRLAAACAGVCYSSRGARELFRDLGEEKIRKRLGDCIRKGHHSVLEHAVFTFSLEGISRVTSHQLVRHRIASYSQQSQRYVRFNGREEYVVPPAIARNPELTKKYSELCLACAELYRECIDEGVPAEDARYIIPSAVSTKLVMTMNARELRHFFALRCCSKAQWEIRKLAWLMLRRVRTVAPALFEGAGPRCMDGACPEDDEECGRKMRRVKEALK